MAKNTLLITATAFDDVTRLAYSVHRGHDDSFGQTHQCEATPDAWGYLLHTLPDAYPIDAVRISVIRRDGPRATSTMRRKGGALMAFTIPIRYILQNQNIGRVRAFAAAMRPRDDVLTADEVPAYTARHEIAVDDSSITVTAHDPMPCFFLIVCAEEAPQYVIVWWGPLSLSPGDSCTVSKEVDIELSDA